MNESVFATQMSHDSRGATRATGLPPAIVAQSARRLRVLAMQYAFIFFMSDPLLAILFPEDRAVFLASPLRWARRCCRSRRPRSSSP